MLIWIEAHAGLASWVQAVGSILAIIAGFGVAYWQSMTAARKSREETKTRGLALAILIRDDLATLRGQFEALLVDTPFEYQRPPPQVYAKVVPHVIEKHLDQMYLLGDPGRFVLALVATLSSNREMIANAERVFRKGATRPDDQYQQLQAIARRGLDACKKAQIAVSAFVNENTANR